MERFGFLGTDFPAAFFAQYPRRPGKGTSSFPTIFGQGNVWNTVLLRQFLNWLFPDLFVKLLSVVASQEFVRNPHLSCCSTFSRTCGKLS